MPSHKQIGIQTDQIAEFCQRHQVLELATFGSVLREDFRPMSDVDVLVRFAANSPPNVFELAAMERELANILGRKVDLVDRRVIEEDTNYIRRRQILDSAEVLYAACSRVFAGLAPGCPRNSGLEHRSDVGRIPEKQIASARDGPVD
jgi:predicted nucleotidyltransferase